MDQSSCLNFVAQSEDYFYRTAFDVVSSGIAVCSPDGRFLDVNQAFCRITGFSREELLSFERQKSLSQNDMTFISENVNRLLAGEETSFQTEHLFVHKNGEMVWGRLAVSGYGTDFRL
jgi:PAS domain S-box-containing protein